MAHTKPVAFIGTTFFYCYTSFVFPSPLLPSPCWCAAEKNILIEHSVGSEAPVRATYYQHTHADAWAIINSEDINIELLSQAGTTTNYLTAVDIITM